MKVVDKEQERAEAAASPEGKKKKLIGNLALALVVVVLAAVVYVMNHNPAFTGTPHVVTVAGFSIEPGKTTVQELADAGFGISDFSSLKTVITDGAPVTGYTEVFDLTSETEAKSYYNMLKLVREGKSYGALTVVNETSSAMPLADCKVREISVYSSDEEADTATIDGIAMGQLSVEALTAVAGEPERTSDETNAEGKKTSTFWEKGNYSMKLTVKEDGSAYVFTSSYEKQ